jgi:(4-(4-[2-(gamma-L-glutamylamino)ethyl]phenoxymethyl)furan-2-yl)methanamine synthase
VVKVVGFDIGGANTKAAYLCAENGLVKELRTELLYFPFWKRDSTQLKAMLTKLKERAAGQQKLDCISVTMTAELSDAYRTKREGVNHILDCLTEVFPKTKLLVLTVDVTLVQVEVARAEPLRVAAANWAATGWMISQLIRDCVAVDVGSTSTSIIPIVDGKVEAKGKTDLEKLVNGELVYTGSLRTNVAATITSVPLRGSVARVSSELFAQLGDAHLVLGNIQPEEYTSETADGKEKTRSAAMARLARVVCADTEMLTEKEIIEIATYVWVKQVDQIADGINQVYSELKPNAKSSVPVVTAGLGRDFLAKKGAQKAGVRSVMDLTELMPSASTLASPAMAVALMAATKLEGRKLRWTQ